MQAAMGYLRVSTAEQGRSGLGLAAQRNEIAPEEALTGNSDPELSASPLRNGRSWKVPRAAQGRKLPVSRSSSHCTEIAPDAHQKMVDQ